MPLATLELVGEQSGRSGPVGRVRPPGQLRAAAGIVGLEGLTALAFAGYLVLRAGAATLGLGPVLGEAGMFVVLAAALLAVARGLALGRYWARSPAVVTQILLLPVAWSLAVPSHQLLGGAALAVLVVVTLGLLMSAPARDWALDLDDRRREG